MGSGLRDRVHGWVDWFIVSVVDGGPAGQRRVALMLYLLLAPLGTIALAVYGALTPSLFVLRVGFLSVAAAYIYLRHRMTRLEWWAVAAVVPAVGNAQGQWLGESTLGVVFAVNACLVVACVSIVFDARFLAAVAATFTAATLVAQLHLHPTATALGVTAATGVSLTLLMIFVHGAASDLRRVASERSALHAEREIMYRRMQAAADQERVKIAGELHDDAVQVLVAGTIQLERAAAQVAGGASRGDVAAAVQAAGDTIASAIDRIRSLSFDLYPPQLESAGLGLALEALGRDAEAHQHGLTVTVSVAPGRVEPEAEQLAYRTIKELTTNALKHADARSIRLTATHDETMIRCEVQDDGRGYDPAEHQARRRAGHIGLDVTAERVRLAGGEFEIGSGPDQGTRARFAIPLGPPDDITATEGLDEPAPSPKASLHPRGAQGR